MTIERYFDKSDIERARLTCAEVDELLIFELMELGVRRPAQPELLPVEFPDVATQEGWLVGYPGKYGVQKLYIFFLSRKNAEAFIALEPHLTELDYGTPEKYRTAVPIAAASVSSVALADPTDLARVLSDAKQAASNKKANTEATDKYSKACRAVEESSQKFWDDWHEQRDTLKACEEVRDLFAEYLATCEGDRVMAARFLRKVYPLTEVETQHRIQTANRWLALDILLEDPAEAMEEESADVP